MGFYSFKLDLIKVKHRRGKIPDNDVVTFGLLVNQIDRGHGSAIFPAMAALDEGVPASAVPPNNTLNTNSSWTVGPLEIEPADSLYVIYSGTNISDYELVSLDTKKQDEIELKILDTIAAAGVSAIAGLGAIAEVIAGALGVLTGSIAKLIGFEAQGPCNGLVFSDAVEFSGGGLDNLDMVPVPHANASPPLPTLSRVSFTRNYTDEATHDSNICGHIAETEITFSVFRSDFISVTRSLSDRFPQPKNSIRAYSLTATTFTLKSLLGLVQQ